MFFAMTKSPLSHPDFLSLGIEDKVGVEEIRNFIRKLADKPFAGKYKVAVIDNMHLLNAASANALLKTLEEPTGFKILILITAGKVLRTIESRTQLIRFNVLTDEIFQEALSGLNIQQSEALSQAASGSLGRAIYLSKNKEELDKLNYFLDELTALPIKGQAEKLLMVKEFSELEVNMITEVLKVWLSSLKKSLGFRPENYLLVYAVLLAIKRLQTNMNKKFILQDLFLT
jgi:DNA polymerase-3 subunit delta'